MIVVKPITATEWVEMAANAHLICFNEKRPASMDRIDYVLLNVRGDEALNYCTVKELDAESVYWQYGGAFPNTKGTIQSAKSYARNIDWTFKQGYKRITTYVRNDNIAMLKIQLKCGFRVIGTRTFKNEIYLEMLLEGSGESSR